MITQAMDRTRFPSLTRHCRLARAFLAVGLGLGVLALSLAISSRASAAPLSSSGATNAPLKYPTYLDHQGLILSNSASTHALAARDKAKAAYVAYKLKEGAEVSKSIPLMKTTARLPLPQAARQAMTTVASGTGNIAVRTKNGLYLLNAYNRGQKVSAQRLASPRVTTPHIAVRAQHITPTTTESGSSGTTGTSSAPLIPPSGLLTLDSPKATDTETQTTTAPTTSSSLVLVPAGNPLEAPVPEPGTLAFAGLVIAGFAVRHGLKRRGAPLV